MLHFFMVLMTRNLYPMTRLIFALCLCLRASSSFGQLAEYEFNENFQDVLGGYHAVAEGDPFIENNQYVSLDTGDYLLLPNTLNAAFDASRSLEIQVRFKVEGDWMSTSGEDARIILSSKGDYDQRLGGFDITARQWEGQLRIITTFGDGINFEPGQCASCCSDCIQSEGKLDFVSDIDSGNWYDLVVKFIFDEETPYIQYSVNNSVSISYFDDRVDYDGFRELLNQQPIAVGADLGNNIIHHGDESLDLQVDYLMFASPVLSGDAGKVGTVLASLTAHMRGEESFSETQIDSLHGLFVANWDATSYAPNKEVIHTYMDTYSDFNGALFDQLFKEAPDQFPPLEAIQYQMQQWILDNQYSPEKVGEMEGLVFKDHELFPGVVSQEAPRLASASFTIDANYQTDPGFILNGQEEVIRPTGYYVPPGELVRVMVPNVAVGKGLTLFVGAHRKNVQETWNEFTRFPRIGTTYIIDSEVITVANPFGGGIYITVPDGTQLGALIFEVNGAVKAPYYSIREGFETSLITFQEEIASSQVPWIDMESTNFMCTIPHGMASQMIDPDSILSVWDQSFDAVNVALGRPLTRFRGEYLIIDRNSHVKFTAAPASYPMSLETVAFPYENIWSDPVSVEQGRDWYRAVGSFNFIIFHEYGHLHNMPTLLHEQETNVHLPATAAYSMAMGESIDSAFVYALSQRLNLEEATLDWIITPNFYEGRRIGFVSESPGDQLLYQSRGLVKLVDIAKMFGWEALGEVNRYFYDYQVNNPLWSPYSLGDDQLIAAASEVLGFNMAPHFEFHGILPSDSLVDVLQGLPTSDRVKERILHYRAIVPRDNEAIQPWYHSIIPGLDPNFHLPRWNEWRRNYDETHAGNIISRIDTILNRYYELTEADFNQAPVITGLIEPLRISENASITLSLNDLRVEDADHVYPDEFTLIVLSGESYLLDDFTITPTSGFNGELNVPVKVSDGIEESEEFLVKIEVNKLNDVPVITGLSEPLTIAQGTSLTLTLGDFQVEDTDHNFPDDFTLIISPGDDYTLEEHTVIPEGTFTGTLSVPIQVSDGIDESEVYLVPIEVLLVLTVEEGSAPISIYPNPIEDILHFDIQATDPVTEIKLFSLAGGFIQRFGPEKLREGTLNFSKLASGTYLLRLTTASNHAMFKVVKE